MINTRRIYGENNALLRGAGNGIGVPGGKTRFMKGAKGRASSPEYDYGRAHWGAVGLSRELHMNSSLPNAIKERLLTYVIGDGLNPEPHISAEYAGISEEEARKYEELITKHWKIWESDYRATWEQNMSPLQQEKLAFVTWIVSGDFFFTVPSVVRNNWPYRTAVKVLAPDYVRTPDDHSSNPFDPASKDIVNGVEIDQSTGMVKSYWVANYYADQKDEMSADKRWHKPFPAFDPINGGKVIHHAFAPDRIGQRRGLPFIYPVVELLQALTSLTETQLINAVVSSYFNVIVTDDTGAIDTFNEAYNENDTVTGGGSTIDEEGTPIAGEKYEGQEHEAELASGGILYMPGNKKVTIANPNKESNSFAPFYDSIVTQIGANCGIAKDVLLLLFGDSFSASRASLMMSFRKFTSMRKHWIGFYKKPIYEDFICDLANRSILPVSEKELITDPWKMAIWATVQWRGPSMGHIQPLQEVQAAQLRVDCGFSNHEIEAKEMNSDITYSDISSTLFAEETERAKHRSELNQKYPLNTVEKISTTRTYFDTDPGGGGDITNPKEQLKAQRVAATTPAPAKQEGIEDESFIK